MHFTICTVVAETAIDCSSGCDKMKDILVFPYESNEGYCCKYIALLSWTRWDYKIVGCDLAFFDANFPRSNHTHMGTIRRLLVN